MLAVVRKDRDVVRGLSAGDRLQFKPLIYAIHTRAIFSGYPDFEHPPAVVQVPERGELVTMPPIPPGGSVSVSGGSSSPIEGDDGAVLTLDSLDASVLV